MSQTQTDILKRIIREVVEDVVEESLVKHLKFLKEAIVSEQTKGFQVLAEQQLRARKEINSNPYSSNNVQQNNPYQTKPIENTLKENLRGNFGDLADAWKALNVGKDLNNYRCE
jgi:hypothetical protein